MANVQTSIDIAAPAQRVWELVTDLERLGDWVSIDHDFPDPPPAEVKTGTRFQQTLVVAGTPFAVEWTAADVKAAERLTWDGAGPAGELGQAASGVVSGYAGREAESSLARLKQIAEG
jgi:uncharacterized protein YndB with AHSA1/START domain